jgi:hypothetical protein
MQQVDRTGRHTWCKFSAHLFSFPLRTTKTGHYNFLDVLEEVPYNILTQLVAGLGGTNSHFGCG